MLALMKIDFPQNNKAIRHLPLDKKKSQYIEAVTPEK